MEEIKNIYLSILINFEFELMYAKINYIEPGYDKFNKMKISVR